MSQIEEVDYAQSIVDALLRVVDYSFPGFTPTKETFAFFSFIQLVNGGRTENSNPLVHYMMIDKLFTSKNTKHAVMSHRGIAKSMLMGVYLPLYIAVTGSFPGFGPVDYAIYVADSMENNVRTTMNTIRDLFESSDFLKDKFEIAKFTDTRMTLVRHQIVGETKSKAERRFYMSGYGASTGVRGPLALNEVLYTDNGKVTMRDISVGDMVFMPNGSSTKVTGKSEVFNDDMYEITYKDGRKIKVNHSHLNVVWYKKNKRSIHEKEIVKTTDMYADFIYGKRLFTKYTEPVNYSHKNFKLNPYLIGVALGDGHMPYSKGMKISGIESHCEHYYEKLKDEYDISRVYFDERSGQKMLRLSIHGITEKLRQLKIAGIVGEHKFIPDEYFYGSIAQRKELLAGLLDTDGTCSIDKRCNSSKTEFSNISKALSDGVVELARSLGYRAIIKAQLRPAPRKTLYRVIITGNINPFTLKEKAVKYIEPRNNPYEKVVDIRRISMEPSQCIMVEDDEHEFLTTGYLPTHNTRKGTSRPQLALVDDLIKSNADARSEAILRSIRDTVFSDIKAAMHPTHQRIIWTGTPFNQNDPLYMAIESGAWEPSVYPVCEEIGVDLKKKDFKGSWEDRFTYESVMLNYGDSVKDGSVEEYMQEMMLRISSEENRLIDESKLIWFNKTDILVNKEAYNWYITTDLATRKEKTSDFAVILVWAINSKGDHLLVDGQAKRGEPNDHIEALFDYCQKYSPLSVGIEITGQQVTFVDMLRNKMIKENRYFNIHEQRPGKPGIIGSGRTSKYEKFLGVLHLFSNNKIWVPRDMKKSFLVQEFLNELRGVSTTNTKKRIGSAKHDDVLDCVSQLQFMNIISPSEEKQFKPNPETGVYELVDFDEWEEDNGSSYVF